MNDCLIYKLLESEQTVFSINEIAIIGEETDSVKLKNRINYYTKSALLLNIRNGFYAKQNCNIEGFACKLYGPIIISLEYIVDKIIEDFKVGKAESAPFWIKMGDKFIHIEYFAMRGENGEYLGTIEDSHDASYYRKLEGEQRILSYN